MNEFEMADIGAEFEQFQRFNQLIEKDMINLLSFCVFDPIWMKFSMGPKTRAKTR